MDTHRFTPSRPDGTVCVANRALLVEAEVCGYPAGHPIHAAADEPKTRRPGRGYQGKIESLTARMAAALVQLEHLRTATVEHAAACYRRGRADGTGMISTAQAEQRAVREANDKAGKLFAKITETLAPSAPPSIFDEGHAFSGRSIAALQQAHDFATQSGMTVTEVLGALDVISEAYRVAATTGINDRTTAALTPLETEHDRPYIPGHPLADREPTTPAEQRTGISDRAAAALADVAEVRTWCEDAGLCGPRLVGLLGNIEQALRAGGAA